MIQYFNSKDGVGPFRAGAVVRKEMAFLEEALRLGHDAAIPRDDVPVLSRLAGCMVGSDDNFHFRRPAPAVTKVGNAERAAAAVLLLLFAPLFLFLALLIVLCDGWPVFFKQERAGYLGEPFKMYKFRTMLRDSEKIQCRLQRRGRSDRTFKMAHDPRVTRLGRFLRESFLDELPQLLNIVKGDMSFCGPRPLPPADHGHYAHSDQALRLLGKPGLTGLWQIGGRNSLTFDEMCLLDYYYLCNRSLRLDFWISLRTIGTVLRIV